jgi:hypothetical protein
MVGLTEKDLYLVRGVLPVPPPTALCCENPYWTPKFTNSFKNKP